jgi:CDP-diacylglycerol---glycerol-3-phosphate 3-phosphatidyltransferase
VTLYALKPRFQALLRPLVGALAQAGITANQVTVAAMLGSIAVAALLVAWIDRPIVFLLLPLWLFVRMALNAIDGMLAREFNQKSRLGAYLNEIGDMVSDAALYAPFMLVAPFAAPDVLLVVILTVVSELAGIAGPLIGGTRRYDGPLGKSDRALVFGALGLWIGLGLALPSWMSWLMPLLALALAITILKRIGAAYFEASAKKLS